MGRRKGSLTRTLREQILHTQYSISLIISASSLSFIELCVWRKYRHRKETMHAEPRTGNAGAGNSHVRIVKRNLEIVARIYGNEDGDGICVLNRDAIVNVVRNNKREHN
jgi:hypothetical protein